MRVRVCVCALVFLVLSRPGLLFRVAYKIKPSSRRHLFNFVRLILQRVTAYVIFTRLIFRFRLDPTQW